MNQGQIGEPVLSRRAGDMPSTSKQKHPPVEGVGRRWLDNVIIGARPEGPDFICNGGSLCDAGNQHLLEYRVRLEILDQRQPVAIGLIEFQRDEDRTLALDNLEGFAQGVR